MDVIKKIDLPADFKCVNGLTLKLIAVLTMLIDHTGAVLFPNLIVLRAIGRIAFPIYVFLLIEGFCHTRNVRKYEIRLIVFAFLSEIPFDLAFQNSVGFVHSEVGSQQNVFFTLALGLILLDIIKNKIYNNVLKIGILLIFMIGAFLFSTDYSAAGILLVFLFYIFREYKILQIISLAVICLIFYVPLEMFSILAFIPILLYNGKKGPDGRKKVGDHTVKTGISVLIQYAFYAFYPVHLLILHLIDLHS